MDVIKKIISAQKNAVSYPKEVQYTTIDMNPDDGYDICHNHTNNLENVSAADNQKDLEKVSYVDDNNASNWYINGRFSSGDNISFVNSVFKNPSKYHLVECEYIRKESEKGYKVRVVDESGKGISHCALRACYVYKDSHITTVCWDDCDYKTYYTDKDGYFTYTKPTKEGKRVWIEIHIKGNDDERTWLCG